MKKIKNKSENTMENENDKKLNRLLYFHTNIFFIFREKEVKGANAICRIFRLQSVVYPFH